jgi:UDP-glucuronate 4-epimerase
MSGDAKIVVAGATGSVALPVTLGLAENNEVWALARFSDPALRQRLEDSGVRCVVTDLATATEIDVPGDVDFVANFTLMNTGEWGRDLDGNAGGVGMLMHHFAGARAFLHCSSTAVYQPGTEPFTEDGSLGDNHRVWSFMETYSISKIAAEAMARFGARQYGLPTTIARLNVPYGAGGGWPAGHLAMMQAGQPIPVHPDDPNAYNPIHSDDIAAMVPKLWDVAAVPATVVNWGGSERVGIVEWCRYLGELVGVEPEFVETDQTIRGVSIDTTKMESLVGPTTVDWRDGMRRLVADARAAAS